MGPAIAGMFASGQRGSRAHRFRGAVSVQLLMLHGGLRCTRRKIELASVLLHPTRAMHGVITGRDVMQNVGIIYREFGVRCLARCLWVLAIGKRTTFLELITEF